MGRAAARDRTRGSAFLRRDALVRVRFLRRALPARRCEPLWSALAARPLSTRVVSGRVCRVREAARRRAAIQKLLPFGSGGTAAGVRRQGSVELRISTDPGPEASAAGTYGSAGVTQPADGLKLRSVTRNSIPRAGADDCGVAGVDRAVEVVVGAEIGSVGKLA